MNGSKDSNLSPRGPLPREGESGGPPQPTRQNLPGRWPEARAWLVWCVNSMLRPAGQALRWEQPPHDLGQPYD